MPNRAIDYNSITEPLGQSMSMVAQHMLRQPQIRYRLDMEARKLASQQIVDQAQAGNYNAQARGHTAKAVGDEQRNGAFDRLNTGGGIAKLHGMIAGTMPFNAAEYDAAMSDFALAFGVSGRDAIELIRKGAQGAAAKSGVPARANAEATGDITSIANNDADITAQAARGYSLSPGARRYDAAGNLVVENPSAASQREAEYETTTTDYPEIPAQEAVPATPAKSRWFGSDTPEIPGKPAVPGQPARKVTTRRKLGDFNHITNPAAAATPAAAQAEQSDFVQPQDPDDSDASGRAADPQSRMDSLIREAQLAIQQGADPAAVMKRAKEKYGVTLTIK